MKSFEDINTFYREKLEREVSEDLKLYARTGPLQFVYGSGPERADAVLIGEAPGKEEVRLGKPFVGKAGAILNEILAATGIKRESLYITNAVKYRLARPGKRPGTYANRPAPGGIDFPEAKADFNAWQRAAKSFVFYWELWYTGIRYLPWKSDRDQNRRNSFPVRTALPSGKPDLQPGAQDGL